jgi:hypothetical protein
MPPYLMYMAPISNQRETKSNNQEQAMKTFSQWALKFLTFFLEDTVGEREKMNRLFYNWQVDTSFLQLIYNDHRKNIISSQLIITNKITETALHSSIPNYDMH